MTLGEVPNIWRRDNQRESRIKLHGICGVKDKAQKIADERNRARNTLKSWMWLGFSYCIADEWKLGSV
jgi:hypothetical protein